MAIINQPVARSFSVSASGLSISGKITKYQTYTELLSITEQLPALAWVINAADDPALATGSALYLNESVDDDIVWTCIYTTKYMDQDGTLQPIDLKNLIDTTNILAGKQTKYGWSYEHASTITMSDSILTVSPVNTKFRYWLDGTAIDKTVSSSVEITNDRMLHYVYFSAVTGDLEVVTEYDALFGIDLLVATVFKDGDTYAVVDLRKPVDAPTNMLQSIPVDHINGFGAILNSDPTTIQNGNVRIYGVSHFIDATNNHGLWMKATDGLTNRYQTNQSSALIYINQKLAYDNAGVLVAIPSGKYAANDVYYTGIIGSPFSIVIGQEIYDTPIDCVDALPAVLADVHLGWKLLYRAILSNVDDVPRYVCTIDYRTSNTSLLGGPTVINHAALVGRSTENAHTASSISYTNTELQAKNVGAAIDELTTLLNNTIGSINNLTSNLLGE